MSKKGFTLIELLSVVTLIALISLIVLPNILSNVNSKKGELSETNMKLLTSAADVYIDNHNERYVSSFEASGSVYCIPIQSLINDGVLEPPIKDVNGDEINYSDVLEATYDSIYNVFSYNKVSSGDCTEFVNYISRPLLSNNMIPVIFSDGSWRKADINSKWYDYLKKNWANAVVVKEYKSDNNNSHSRYEYLNAPAGTVINEDDILAYFVWIPRFRYQLFNSNSPVSINIVFEGVSSSKSNGSQVGQWLTHPAFTYNGNELPGIWVGKYETVNSNDNPVIKNDTPWVNIEYVDASKKAISMTYVDNIYGFQNVNTHIMRNSEWGAVAYLTSSIYGNQLNNSTTGTVTGVYNLSGNKEFVILDNQDEGSLGYALNETKTWAINKTYLLSENAYLTRGYNSVFDYTEEAVGSAFITYRVTLINK